MTNEGGYNKFMDIANMWFSSGETKSVFHNDDQDNINCLFSGSKRMFFAHPKFARAIEHKKMGWVDTARDPNAKGYGAFSGNIDPDNMDLKTYPGWKKVCCKF